MADEGKICPLHKKDMSTVCHKCPWWTLLRGKHPQTGADIDEWGCAIGMLPMLLCENAKESRQTGAAVETFRNEMVKSNYVVAESLNKISEKKYEDRMKVIEPIEID